MSPFPPPLPSAKPDAVNRIVSEQHDNSPRQSPRKPSPSGRAEQPPVPNIPSNSIHIASSSIDGKVCVTSLVDSKDVILRDFKRPVQTVALSPDYKNDRTYLSGGKAGSLILTVGGQTGKTSVSNTTGASAAAAGWLGSIGLGSHSGNDKELHSGEGSISTIKWSLSGKYVVWVNEQGIKIMRSNLHLEGGESEFAWKRMSHIDRPNHAGWEEMAGVWRARAEWIDEDGLESTDEEAIETNETLKKSNDNADTQSILSNLSLRRAEREKRKEKLIVGWGGTIWIIDVHPVGTGIGREAGERKIGKVEIVTM